MPRVHVFCGASLDGFIAGPNDELDWLSGGGEDAPADVPDSFGPFFAGIGAVLMGRRTYDIVAGFDQWFYGETPMLIATSRPLSPTRPSVRAVHGSIEEMVAEAKRTAGERDVYVDGGRLIRSTLDAGLVDHVTVTVLPIVLGQGIALFAGAAKRHPLELLGHRVMGETAVELRYRVPR